MSQYPRTLPSTLQAIPSGVAGVRATLGAMVKLTKGGRKDVAVIQLARSIVLPVATRDYRGQVHALFHWVKQHIRYVADPRDVETISTPVATLKMQSGDCDDMSVLLASLLEAIGYQTRFVAYGFEGEGYSHVIVETKLGPIAWVSLDPTVPTSTVGWKPPNATRMMTAHV